MQFVWAFMVPNDRLTTYLLMKVGFWGPKVPQHTTLGPQNPLVISENKKKSKTTFITKYGVNLSFGTIKTHKNCILNVFKNDPLFSKSFFQVKNSFNDITNHTIVEFLYLPFQFSINLIPKLCKRSGNC